MKFNKTILMFVSYFIGSAFILLGAYLKITHQANANTFLQIGLPISFIFVVLSVTELFRSNKINQFIRWLWVIGLMCCTTLFGFIYLTRKRQQIINP